MSDPIRPQHGALLRPERRAADHAVSPDPELAPATIEPPTKPLLPAIHHPLAGAMGGEAIRTSAAERPWRGPVVGIDALHEARERALLDGAGRSVVLAALEDFDARKPPVVLVHGIAGSADDLRDLAARLRAAGRQVLIAFYDDKGTRVPANGAALAAELAAVRARHYAEGRPLDIVGYSMGGIVTRCALNTLEDPQWLDAGAAGAAVPRAGFGRVRVLTIDTPWEGGGGPDLPPVLRDIVQFFMGLFGGLGAFDMMSHSKMFEHLYEVPLHGVELQNHAAREDGDPDSIRSIPDLHHHELAVLARFVAQGVLPRAGRVSNIARGLAQDERFAALRERYLASDQTAEALVQAYEATMPRFRGDHVSVLSDGPGEADLIDHIVRALCGC